MSARRQARYLLAGLFVYFALSVFGFGVSRAYAACTLTYSGGFGNDQWRCATPDEAWAKVNEMNPHMEPWCPAASPPQYSRFMYGKQASIKFACGAAPVTAIGASGAGNANSTGDCPVGTTWVGSLQKCAAFDPDKVVGCDDNCQAPGTRFGNPINVAIGNKYQQEDDVAISTLLRFSRYYNSIGEGVESGLGTNWTHTYSRKVTLRQPSKSGYPEAIVSHSDGHRTAFRYIATKWTPDADVYATLVRHNDAQGVLLGWTYVPRDAREVEEYDALGRLFQVRRTDGTKVDLTYNNGVLDGTQNDFRLTEVRAQDDRRLVFGYDASGRINKLTAPSGAEYGYSYGGTGLLTEVSYPGSANRGYLYNESTYTGGANLPTALTGITDENNQRFATFSYSADGKPVSTEHAGGVDKFMALYNEDGSANVTGPLGQSLQTSFVNILGIRKASAVVEQCPGCVAHTTGYTYDTNGRVNVVTDSRGVTTDSDFDARGLLTQKIEAANDTTGAKRKTVATWHTGFALATERRTYDASGTTLVAKQAWTYNSRGQALTASRIDPATSADRVTTTTYCEQADVDSGACPFVGLVLSVDGPRTDVSDTTAYTYYAADEATCATSPTTCPYRKGDLWKLMNALGQVTETLRYEGAGRRLSVKDANGVITDFEYHPRGWLTTRKVRGTDDLVETDDAITRIEYWPTGLVKQVTQPDGAFTAYTYDAAHRLTDIADNLGNNIHYTLDNAGNRTGEDTKDSTGTLLRTLSRVYDQLGQLQTAKDAYQQPTGFGYDTNGNTDTVTDALSRVSDNDYDPLNRLAKTIQDVGGIDATTQFQYDALDNLTQVTDPKGLNTGYLHNGLGDLIKLTSPDTGITDYTYDSAGNRQTQTDARGITATYSYDALNRLTDIAYPTSDLNVTYQYDTVNAVCDTGETFAAGRLNKLTDGSGTTEYCYDHRGNLARKVQTTNGQMFTLRYAYTLADRLASVTYPSGARVDYTRNALGQPSGVTYTPAGGSAQALLTNVTYYPFGPAADLEYGDGRHLKRTLNQNYQPGIVEDLGIDGLSLGYEFDAVGNLFKLRKGDQTEPPLRKYGYDGLNRLTEVRDGVTDALLQGYDYDDTGNRTSATVDTVTTAYGYPAYSHRLESIGAETRGYDAVGNTTAIGGMAKEFVYSADNRMSQVKQAGAVAMNYAYNSRGEQVRRYPTATSSAQTYAVYDEAGHVLGSYDVNGARLQELIWLDDLPVGVIANNQLHYVEADHLGTPRRIIDPAREKAVWRWELAVEAFGNSSPNQDPDADGTLLVFDLRFPGQRYDAASGLNQNYFRDYDTGGGRYVQSDPIGLGGGISTYGYALSNPMRYADRLGLQAGAAPPRPFFPAPTPGLPGQNYPGGYPDPEEPWIQPSGPIDIRWPPAPRETFPGKEVPKSPPQMPPQGPRSGCRGMFEACMKGANKCPVIVKQGLYGVCLAAFMTCQLMGGDDNGPNSGWGEQ